MDREVMEKSMALVKRSLTGVLGTLDEDGNPEKDLFGCSGGYKTRLSKNTVEKPCPVCGSIIKKEAYMGGSVYYCSGCQVI